VVEPSISNMGYITTVLSRQERQKAGPKGGAQAAATVALDPLGSVSVAIGSVPQGRRHRTVTAQIVADIFGLTPAAIRVDAGLDTGKDAWSIAAGNYSSRFAGATLTGSFADYAVPTASMIPELETCIWRAPRR
jgi:2-furoyl-CoA dehydrogenase large subunit